MMPSAGYLRARYEAEGSVVRRYDAAEFWDRRYHRRRFAMIEATLGRLFVEGEVFLDVGCGSGEYLALAADRGVEAVGVDLSEAYCRRIVASGARRPVVGDAAALPFASRSCDVVLCSEVIEHLPPSVARGCIDELTRVARRAIVVTTPNAAAFIRRLARRVARATVSALDDEVGHINLLTRRELVAVLARPGWAVSRLTMHHVAPPLVGAGPLRLGPGSAPTVAWVERWADRRFAAAGNLMIAVLEAQDEVG